MRTRPGTGEVTATSSTIAHGASILHAARTARRPAHRARPRPRGAGRRCGREPRHPGAEGRLECGQQLVAHRAARALTPLSGCRALFGSSHGARPVRGTPREHLARQPQHGRRSRPRRRACRTATGPRTAGERQEHLLGLVVAGVAEQHGLAPARRPLRQCRVPGLTSVGLPDPAGDHRTDDRLEPEPSAAPRPAGHHRAARLEPVVDHDGTRPHPARGATNAAAAARASESGPPEHATRTRCSRPARSPARPARSARPDGPRAARRRPRARARSWPCSPHPHGRIPTSAARWVSGVVHTRSAHRSRHA